jgi:hypothetical protein
MLWVRILNGQLLEISKSSHRAAIRQALMFEGALINVSSLGLASFFGSIISHVRSYQQ